tara:strand:- start:407 stop:607 length:201 start_codon:yes stop_codon:yes gene_type:complete
MSKKTGNNQHEYGEDFEKMYIGIPGMTGNNAKMASYMMFCRMKKRLKIEVDETKKRTLEESLNSNL